MLAQEFRIQVQNATGVALAATDTIEISGQTWTIGSSGLAYGASTVIMPATTGNSLASAAFANGTAQTGNTAFGFKGIINATISTATPAGNLNFFYQEYDATLGWPGNGEGESIGVMVCTAVGAQTPIQIDF
jgi:hypothetical protein